MPNHASVTIIGHLGHDPAVRAVGDHNVANFSIAVSKKRGGKENTTWYNVAAWNKLGEVASNYLKKGSAVMITGDLQMETFKKNDGTDGVKLAVDARELVLLGKASGGNEAQAESTETAPAPVAKAMQQAQATTAAAGGQITAANANDPPF